MPDLAAAIGPIAALLSPVVALMFVALRLRRRLSYPHELLPARNERSPATALFRWMRLYADTILDATCAVLIGLALTGWPRPARMQRDAVVIDASLSMAAGMRGARPLDEATRVASSMRAEEGADVYVLGWNPATRSPTVSDISRLVDDRDEPQALATALDGSESFMSVSYDLLASLQSRYRSVFVLTDAPVEETAWLRVRRLQPAPERYLYITSAVWDEAEGKSVARFVAYGGAAPTALWQVFDDGSLARARPEDYRIVPGTSGFSLSLARAGLWAVQWEGHVLPFEAPGPAGAYRADGDFASMLARALNPRGAQLDGPPGQAAGVILRDGGGRDRPGAVSVARAERQTWVLDPARTLGAVIAVGIDRNADLALGDAALAAPQTAMPFWLARAAAGRRIAGADRVPARTAALRVGDGFLYARPGQPPAALVVPPIEEYAHDPRPIVVRPARNREPRLVLALVLLILYALKVLVARSIASARRANIRSGPASPGSARQNQA